MNRKQVITEQLQETINIIAERVKQGREAKHMSQVQLAEALECSLKYVKRMERGDVPFSLLLLIAIMRVLEISPFEGVEI